MQGAGAEGVDQQRTDRAQLLDRLVSKPGCSQHLRDGEPRAGNSLDVRLVGVVHEEPQLWQRSVRLPDLGIRQACVVGAVEDERVGRGQVVPILVADDGEEGCGAAVLPGREQ